MSLRTGLRAVVSHAVADTDTAAAAGSGDLPVLATPRLLALAEQATVEAVRGALGAGDTTVGSRVLLEHRRPVPVGGTVTVTADLVHLDGRLLRFSIGAQDAAGTLVATGEVTRVVVDRTRFLARR